MVLKITEELLFITQPDFSLHIKRFYSDKEKGIPVILIHGAIENGKIFYSNSQKGLAPYLAKNGYDVFVPDLRGRGKSIPKIDKHQTFGMYDMINVDLDLIHKKVEELKPNQKQVWMAHSWGGVMTLSFLAKNNIANKINKIVFFGVKRRITIFSFQKLWIIDIMWRRVAKLFVMRYGYLPAKRFSFGSDSETKRAYYETDPWVKKNGKWIGLDGFDYIEKLKNINLPPILSITGENDTVVGHEKDCKLLLEEINAKNYEFKKLGKQFGNAEDYDHVSILTSKNAEEDHFKMIVNWLKK